MSEVLHDAGTNSSFDDETDEYNMKDKTNEDQEDDGHIIKKHMKDGDDEDIDNISAHKTIRSPDGDGGRSSKETGNVNFGLSEMVKAEPLDSPPYPSGLLEPRLEGYIKVEREIMSEDSQDSGKLLWPIFTVTVFWSMFFFCFLILISYL